MANLKQIWFEVFSEMYGTTTACVLDIENTIKIGKCDCGSGEVHHLTRHELEQLKNGIEQESEFTSSNKLNYPINLIAMLKCDGNRMDLPKHFSFSKKEYTDLKNEITKAGGVYNKNGFDFIESSELVYDRIISGNDYNLKKKFQFFGTPEKLSDELVLLADINTNDTILEPEAGQGAIIRAINKVCDIVPDCYELMEENKIVLNKSGLLFNLIGDDFLLNNRKKYSKIIANPPFSKNQDIDHILEMYNCLKTGGRLVSIASESWVEGSQQKQKDFKSWLDSVNAKILDIKKGTFKESGASVGGKIIIINKPE